MHLLYEFRCEQIDEMIQSQGLNQQRKVELSKIKEQFSQQVLYWRNMHIGLPRNVLGGFGAKSLIGSEDAVSTVYTMRQKYVSDSDCHSTTEEPELVPTLRNPNSYRRKLDDRLLEITSNETKNRFRDVQARSGPIFGKNNNE